MGRLFGTDGVRGIANRELSATIAYQLGRAAAKVLGAGKKGLILVGRDTRRSGSMLEAALQAGICSMGIDVGTLGILPTPAVSYLTRRYEALCGVVISASHNPGEYNGIKFFNSEGFKLRDELEDEMEKVLKESFYWEGPIGEDVGMIYDYSHGIADYEDYLTNAIPVRLEGVKIALDTGHGALFRIAPRVLERLGAQVVLANAEPDGMNINRQCGSTNPNIIQQMVLESGADVGFSFDGDADRVIAVDERGRIIDGDHILAICAKWLKAHDRLDGKQVVGTVMSNLGLKKFLESQDIALHMAPVGDRYVLEWMQEKGAVIGGEQSGHIIFLDYNTTGDGLATGLHLLEIAMDMGQTFSELNDLMKDYPQTLINAKVPNDKKQSYLEYPVIAAAIKSLEEMFQGEGRVVIRPSGTEPLVRVMIEGKDQDFIQEKAVALARLIEENIHD